MKKTFTIFFSLISIISLGYCLECSGIKVIGEIPYKNNRIYWQKISETIEKLLVESADKQEKIIRSVAFDFDGDEYHAKIILDPDSECSVEHRLILPKQIIEQAHNQAIIKATEKAHKNLEND